MALIKCPECGRENVSDSAEMCPDCGYGIKVHFDRVKREEEKKEYERKAEEARRVAEIEAKRREKERIESIPQLERPQLTAPIVILGFSALLFWMGKSELSESAWEVEWSIANGHGDPHFNGILSMVIGIGLVCYGICLFLKRLKIYKLSKTNLEEYRRYIIREQDLALAAARAEEAARAREEAKKPECPYCHSHKTSKITITAKAVNTAMFGVFGQKRNYQWHCNNCKSNF